MEKNNCNTCNFRSEVPGSAHSACNHPAITGIYRLQLATALATGVNWSLTNKETGEDLLAFHKTGIQGGWCLWPINFDPVWVTCRLPLKKKENDDV
jgi:hypothetical protein